jgi:hypothetical protein
VVSHICYLSNLEFFALVLHKHIPSLNLIPFRITHIPIFTQGAYIPKVLSNLGYILLELDSQVFPLVISLKFPLSGMLSSEVTS